MPGARDTRREPRFLGPGTNATDVACPSDNVYKKMPAAAVCPECNGTGWKIVEREEVSGAVRCDCVATERAERLESSAGIPPLYANASFDNFLLPRENPVGYRELTEVYLAVRG